VNRGITTSRSSSVLWKELRDRGAGNEQLCDLGSEAAWSPRPHRHPSSGIRSKEQTSRCPPAHDWSQLDAKVRRIKSEPGVMHDVHKPDRVTGTPMIGRLAISAFARQARQQVDVPHCLDRLFRARTVPIIPILVTNRRATFSPMHSTDATAANRGRTTALPRPFRFSFAPRRVVGALHGVDGHFDLAPPPIPTGSGGLRKKG
jgi:hypothetical protein